MKGLTDIPGIRVGHVSDFDAITGCTAILCEQGAVGGVDIRGSASGTQEIDTLDPDMSTDQVHGILLAGGSAFGLEAAVGRASLSGQRGRRRMHSAAGKSRSCRRPFSSISASAKSNVHPNAAMGEAAAAAATSDAGHGRLCRRGYRRHRRQALRHDARHEGRHRIVHRRRLPAACWSPPWSR